MKVELSDFGVHKSLSGLVRIQEGEKKYKLNLNIFRFVLVQIIQKIMSKMFLDWSL